MPDDPFGFSSDPADWVFTLGLVALWLVLTIVLVTKHLRAPAATAAETIVVHASQTGHASDLAQQAQLRIEASGVPCAIVEADNLTPELLAGARRVIFVAATTGEGAAPDNARRFERDVLSRVADLFGKQVGILALGDRRYPQFCSFGRLIEEWARRSGAEPLFPLLEVDDLAVADLALWNMRLTAAGFAESTAPAARVETRWHVMAREQVAGPTRDPAGDLTSDGLFRIALRPAEGVMPHWEIGDLFELTTPDGHLRDYSIASLPGDDAILLFVRRVIGKGVAGAGSGHLTQAPAGSASAGSASAGSASIVGCVRSHRSFRPPTGGGPLLAIGAGSGWAGLRPHLLHAMAQGQPCRLVFGEREAEVGSPILAEMRSWQRQGRLDRLDLALSRPGGSDGPYVQHILAEPGLDIAEFLGTAGRIVVCGRLAMGEQTLTELARIVGEDWLDAAREEGRLQCDLY